MLSHCLLFFFFHQKSSFLKINKILGTEVHLNSLSWISLWLKRPNGDRAEAEVGEEEEKKKAKTEYVRKQQANKLEDKSNKKQLV